MMPKGETEHKNISQQRQHWAKCVLCLSDVVVVDGFLAPLYCFSLLKSHFVLP